MIIGLNILSCNSSRNVNKLGPRLMSSYKDAIARLFFMRVILGPPV